MVRALALGLTFLTGSSGLVYEIAWQKYLAILLGSHGEATAAVLAIFLGGLSLGYALFGRLASWSVGRAEASGRPARLLATYGLVEAGIGIYAFAFPILFSIARSVSAAVPLEGAAAAFLFDVSLSALLIGPPSVLMGGTIPLLTQALAEDLDDATRIHARIYAYNTAGAFLGALAAGFWLVPTLGLVGVIQMVGWLNLLAGASFVALGWRPRPVATRSRGSAPAVEGFGLYAGVAGILGFSMMAIQIVFIRLAGLSLGSSHFTFAMVVAVFVLCIALGSLLVSTLPRIPAGVIVANFWLLVALLTVLYPALGDGPYWAHALRSLFRDQSAGFYPFYANLFVALLLVIGPPVILSGAALPLLFHHLRRQLGDLGDVAGRLYSWNTVGSLLGALVGGYLLFYWLDLHAIYRVAVGALAFGAALLSLRVLPARSRVWAAALALPAVATLILLPAWAPKHLAAGTFRYRQPRNETYDGPDRYFQAYEVVEVPFYEDDPTVSVAVVDHPVGNGERSLAIVTNGKPDGSIAIDYTTMALAALVPAVLVERVERAFVIGYGTGVTVGEFAALDEVREVVVAEISSGVMHAAPFFDAYNLNASKSPVVRVVRSDAYRALQRSDVRYDVIASEPSNPWVTGTEMLFSREFLEAARSRLAPGGVYMQWFHSYETDSETIALVLNTFSSVFGGVAVWYATGVDLLLLGFDAAREEPDLEQISTRARRPDIAAGLARSGIDGVPELLAHELFPPGVVDTLELGESVHTLLHPILSDRAARAFFRGGQGSLPDSAHLRSARAGAGGSLIRRLAARTGGRLAREARGQFVDETCQHRPQACAVVIAQWRHDEPDETRHRELEAKHRRRPGYQKSLSRRTLRVLTELFERENPEGDGSVSLAEARRTTDAFARFYHHAAPFERAALRAAWDRCARQPGQEDACRRGRAAAEKRLGDLESNVAATFEFSPAVAVEPAGEVATAIPAAD